VSTLLGQGRIKMRRPLPVPPRPRLTIVPKLAARAPRIPFVVLVVVLLASGLIGLLLVNTSLQSGTYRVSALQSHAETLDLRQQQLEQEVSELSQPGRVAREATRMGMVQNISPAFLDLRTAKITGDIHVAAVNDEFLLAPAGGEAARRASEIQATQDSESARDRALADDHRTTEQIAAERRAAQRNAREKARASAKSKHHDQQTTTQPDGRAAQ
jgi:hypothetical protein